jgi:UDPglucose 6-dehydrogenase
MEMEIAVVGAGHMGVVCAMGLGYVGHRVRVHDVDGDRIDRLGAGELPFYEPWAQELLAQTARAERVTFHRDPAEALAGTSVVFVCVDTPNKDDGQVDLSAVTAAGRTVARFAGEDALLVNRSTVPVGTAEYLRTLLHEEARTALVAVNPEFLAEGRAVRDFLDPHRVVIGAWEDETLERILAVYRPILERRVPDGLPAGLEQVIPRGGDPVPVVTTAPATAELIKYAANAYLAVKISFINEMAWVAEEVGADISEVARAIGLDPRIGPQFLRAGLGWGGSCFPKDIVALKGMAETRGLSARMIHAANEVNARQRQWVAGKLQRHLATLVGRRVGLLGVAFKPHTDDLRNAPALEIAEDLSRMNVRVRAFDPAVKSLPTEYESILELTPDAVSLADGADALVLVTEWPEFGELDFGALGAVMRGRLVLDGRNFLDPSAVRAAGLTYERVGSRPV